MSRLAVTALIVMCTIHIANAAVLPEDRADLMYHLYDGGGAEIDGPAVLFRKGFGDKFSLSGKYYVDSVTSASVDVVTTASKYTEERKETNVSASYLYDATIFSLAYTQSDENDFEANSAFFSISQELFGAMTTVTLGYGIGSDVVKQNGNPDFEDDVDRQHYRLGLSQVLTKNWVLSMDFETITDEGYLNNPYRSVRFLDSSTTLGYGYEQEIYPRTRTSNSVAFHSKYFLKYGASVGADYRFFTDTWDIEAHSVKLSYVHRLRAKWLVEASYRYYQQTAAVFYSDLFDRPQAQNFLARDKEMSAFSDHTYRAGVSYEFLRSNKNFLKRGSLNFFYNHIQFDYDNFRDLTNGGVAGEEPLYSFSADVIQLYLSVWY